MKAVLPAAARSMLEPHLPADLDVTWFAKFEEAKRGIAGAEIAWVDMAETADVCATIEAAGPSLRWLSTIYAGLDALPLDFLLARNVTVTNGAGINAIAVAEYAVMGILAAAKRFDEVIRAQDRHDWLRVPPGRTELAGTQALIVGYGTIGRMIGERLAAFGVSVTGVTRSGRDGTLKPDEWAATIGRYDWVILAAPATSSTRIVIGKAELAAMKREAWLVNIARGAMIDEDALLAALRAGSIAGAFLDPTTQEPLPADHPLWFAPNTIITMHLSGQSQTKMFPRAAEMFLQNLGAYRAGSPMANVVDLAAGY